jgi:hypothetical protein
VLAGVLASAALARADEPVSPPATEQAPAPSAPPSDAPPPPAGAAPEQVPALESAPPNDAAPPPPAAAVPVAPVPSNATVLGKDEIQGILGKKVLSSTGEDMGQIANVIVDHAGQPRAVVIDFGGFLGVGSRKIAVDWNALHFSPDAKTDQVTLALTRDELKAAPEYKEGSPVVVIGSTGGTQTVPSGDLP